MPTSCWQDAKRTRETKWAINNIRLSGGQLRIQLIADLGCSSAFLTSRRGAAKMIGGQEVNAKAISNHDHGEDFRNQNASVESHGGVGPRQQN
ncbi:hypothetical protein Y1Q_0023258 [Alligator mississippiensis]|uniref:Uncharacterized protein n=1 Tax=Alligator mississippiensis TaxID=8496 RepID=A0A151MJ63_ALLMI|nr:hypothetical protein Y1Q_0023258 [Alligator mississippiensis]